MEQLEFKLKTEVNKNGSLLRMNSSLMNKNDALNRCIYSIHVMFFSNQKLYSPQHEFEQDELEHLLELIRRDKDGTKQSECVNCQELLEEIERMKRHGCGENEERWRVLYNKQSQETHRLSKLNAELTDTIRQFTISRNKNEEELKIFLDDYLQIYKKVNIGFTPVIEQSKDNLETIRENSTSKKRQRKLSANKSRKSQEKRDRTDREKTVIFQETKEVKEGKLSKQWMMLNRLRESAVQQIEVVRKQLIQILKTLKLSEENTRYLRKTLRQQIRNS